MSFNPTIGQQTQSRISSCLLSETDCKALGAPNGSASAIQSNIFSKAKADGFGPSATLTALINAEANKSNPQDKAFASGLKDLQFEEIQNTIPSTPLPLGPSHSISSQNIALINAQNLTSQQMKNFGGATTASGVAANLKLEAKQFGVAPSGNLTQLATAEQKAGALQLASATAALNTSERSPKASPQDQGGGPN